jgi:hypothetical protein
MTWKGRLPLVFPDPAVMKGPHSPLNKWRGTGTAGLFISVLLKVVKS